MHSLQAKVYKYIIEFINDISKESLKQYISKWQKKLSDLRKVNPHLTDDSEEEEEAYEDHNSSCNLFSSSPEEDLLHTTNNVAVITNISKVSTSDHSKLDPFPHCMQRIQILP